MKAGSVLKIYRDFNNLGVKIWLDGGWGVDALLGVQTREHGDLDIVIQEKDLKFALTYFEKEGYKDIDTDDRSPWNFVLASDAAKVDFHVIVLDSNGNGIYGPASDGVFYPSNSLQGIGNIGGVSVCCLTAEYQVVSHSGYKLREKDYFDVKNLCDKFNIPLPKEYQDND